MGLKEESERANALSKVAQIMAREGHLDEALSATEDTFDSLDEYYYVIARSIIASALLQDGKQEQADQIAEQAYRVLENAYISEGGHAHAFGRIALVLAKLGEEEKALAAIKKIYELIEQNSANWFDREDVVRAVDPNLNYDWELHARTLKIMQEGILKLQHAKNGLDVQDVALALTTLLEVWYEGDKRLADGLFSALPSFSRVKPYVWIPLSWQDIMNWSKWLVYVDVNKSQRELLLQELTAAIPLIVAIDNGRTLWDIYDAITEVENWWIEQ
jgi:tetratricopeptide (TPR) repeat protein